MNNCKICTQKFDNAQLLQSKEDDFYCKECFKSKYCTGRQLSTKKKSKLPNKCEGDSLSRSKKMFSLSELAAIKRVRNSKEKFHPSKRPLQCPHMDCNRYVSVFDLTAHFQHEHMDVKIAHTFLDTRNPLTFYPKDMRYGISQCLHLFTVVPQENEANPSSVSERSAVPVTVAVLASRLAYAQLSDDNSEHDLDDEEKNGFAIDQTDKIIIWMASNVLCSYSYTVAVSTVSEDIRVKYFGPVRQLGDSSKNLCLEGNCLVLSQYHFAGMSSNGTRPLHLDVIVHSED